MYGEWYVALSIYICMYMYVHENSKRKRNSKSFNPIFLSRNLLNFFLYVCCCFFFCSFLFATKLHLIFIGCFFFFRLFHCIFFFVYIYLNRFIWTYANSFWHVKKSQKPKEKPLSSSFLAWLKSHRIIIIIVFNALFACHFYGSFIICWFCLLWFS